ncbi:MAG: hypothetical protein J6Q05_00630 [Elusimicrobiaceae bacterium]|nr:hypothetical protein [Elusimicrobiaceae bacterium]
MDTTATPKGRQNGGKRPKRGANAGNGQRQPRGDIIPPPYDDMSGRGQPAKQTQRKDGKRPHKASKAAASIGAAGACIDY